MHVMSAAAIENASRRAQGSSKKDDGERKLGKNTSISHDLRGDLAAQGRCRDKCREQPQIDRKKDIAQSLEQIYARRE